MTVQVIVAHPALYRSRINAHLATVASSVSDVVVTDLYNSYPDGEIDVPREQACLCACHAVVLQHPMYWYATPALLKEWIDLVFAYGFAYGDNNKQLAGKILTQAISTGGDSGAYQPGGFNRFTIGELLRPMEATAYFCGMEWRSPFLTHGGHVISNAEIDQAGQQYHHWLSNLSHHSATTIKDS